MSKKGKKGRPKYHTDNQGPFVWEYYFVRGKQKRTKVRVTVIDGKVVEDADEWLRTNADDVLLHQMERWDLMEPAVPALPETQTPIMKEAPCNLKLDIIELEGAFESLDGSAWGGFGETGSAFLDLTNGGISYVEPGEDDEEYFDDKFLPLPSDLFEELRYGSLDAFVETLGSDPIREKLEKAIRGKGAFRRFKDIVFDGGNEELKRRWLWFETRRKRKCIAEWLRDRNIQPDWGCDIFEAPVLPGKRADLLRAVLAFVRAARVLPGVGRIALLGSLATPKAIPKDVDLLVEIEDDMQLDQLAAAKRRLLGATMQTGDGCGADVFLCDPNNRYLGRVCGWKECAPGIRLACDAQHCGRRKYLHDDLQAVRLDAALIAAPAVDLWPEIIMRTELPDDVRKLLVSPIDDELPDIPF